MSDCILWEGGRGGSLRYGYQWDKVTGRSRRAHRMAWERAYGPIPAGMCVLHRCDVPHCVNPEHLFLGTVGQNNADRASKGRNGPYTTRPPKGRPEMAQARNPFARWFAGQTYHTTQAALAEKLGCDRSYVTMMLRETLDCMPSLQMAIAIDKLTDGEVSPKDMHDFVQKNRRREAA